MQFTLQINLFSKYLNLIKTSEAKCDKILRAKTIFLTQLANILSKFSDVYIYIIRRMHNTNDYQKCIHLPVD